MAIPRDDFQKAVTLLKGNPHAVVLDGDDVARVMYFLSHHENVKLLLFLYPTPNALDERSYYGVHLPDHASRVLATFKTHEEAKNFHANLPTPQQA